MIRRLFMLLYLGACAQHVLKEPSEALRLTATPETLSDDLGAEDLLKDLELQIKYFSSEASKRFPILHFGPRVISKDAYREALLYVLQSSRASAQPLDTFLQLMRDNFEFYEVFGDRQWGEVFITSYFEPEIYGSRTKTPRFSQALFRSPDDMVEIDLSKFQNLGSDSSKRSVVARISSVKNAQGQAVILPYFNRKEIDYQGQLNGRKLELLWVDPIDSFFLQIQGSGTIILDEQTRIRVGYAAQNGFKYEAIGNYLKDVIPKEKLSAHTIETYLRSLSPEKLSEILSKNPSYVFFKETTESAVTFSGIPAFSGRSMATDTRYFPKGALAFLGFDKPEFSSPVTTEASVFKPVARFTFDHDKGGAINGSGRVDLFWGRGLAAKQASGVMKSYGKLYYLAPKEAFLKRLPSFTESSQ